MQDRLRDVKEGKGRGCLQYHHRAIFIFIQVWLLAATVFSLGSEETDKSCQNCTQSHHPHRISSLNFPTALIWAYAVLTVWFLGLPSIREYIKMPEAPFARELQLHSQVRVSPPVTLMQFLFLMGMQEEDWRRRANEQAPVKIPITVKWILEKFILVHSHQQKNNCSLNGLSSKQ